ncbi:NAD(P)H-flavin reductase [Streptomyces sp. TLI_053]|uniref:globin domain-containing protein n=1 Tax=Streptomyces sp. TLI_053 TaxID=1855352 RepID=UPI000879FABF|nr:globin domain-containing protein [Streptomyces sp. TLI_053]SDT71189.1 NAD(P)H-flavin reductase [Streptomyces sp. TLI_053]
MKSRRTLLVRTGHGSAAASAVPGLPEAAPGGVPDAAPDGGQGVAPDAGADVGAADAAEPPVPPVPPDLPPVSGAVGPAPVAPGPIASGPIAHGPIRTGPVLPLESVLSVVPVQSVRPVVPMPPSAPPALPASMVVPPRPVEPPAVPAPPAAAVAPGGAVIEPLFPSAPGLNWAGPGDQWSRAWVPRDLGGAASPAAPATAPPVAAAPAAPLPAAPEARDAAELPPTARDIELIRTSLAVVEPVADRATAHFYALIFLSHPEIRALFPAAMDVQRDRLFRALLTAARSAGDPEGLRAHLGALGRGHRRYGTLTGHYGPVGECLVAALAKYAGSRWNAETELAWRRVYRLVSSIMIEAAEEAARTSPPWWQGEVVAHERRTPDVAVLTVRPDQAYPYRAGQYTSLETPWWPRVWRHFSFASAPRPDGLLTFHVKAVQAGWVSNALVHRAAPGDLLRLGPAVGGMTLDDTDDGDLLLVGGGTGIAPLRALVEEVAGRGSGGRSVEVFHGARTSAELYELAALRELAERHRWLTVRAVLSGPGAGTAESAAAGLLAGELPEAVARFGPWTGRTAYLSGPPAMVRRTSGVLLRAGLPAERIRHDLVGDLAAP